MFCFQLLKKQKISTYDKNNLLLRLINISDQKISDENIPSTRVNYVEKKRNRQVYPIYL